MYNYPIMNETYNYPTMAAKEGRLEIFLGPMFSGKTTRLISIYKRNKIAKIPTCVVNYIDDTRYSETQLSTHDQIMIPCLHVSRLYDIFDNDNKLLHMTEVFIINEGQFFPDLFEVVRLLVKEHNKTVYVGGLDGDYKMEKFGQMLDIIPLCNRITKLNAICTICKQPAAFTKRLTEETEQKVIGSDNYIPVCRICHFNASYS